MKRLLFLLVLVAILSVACREQTKEEIFLQGMEFVDNGNHQAAVTLFKNALEKDPNYIDARLQLGFAYLETRKYDKAENELEKALRQQPDNYSLILKLSEIYLRTDRSEKAIGQLEKILVSEPENAEALYILAKCKIVLNELQAAEKLLKDSLNLRPGYIPTQLDLAKLYYVTGRTDDGLQLVNAVIKQNPRNTEAFYILMRNALLERDHEGAIEVLEKIRTINRTDIVAAYLLGMLYLDAGQVDAARQISSELIANKPGHPAGYRIEGVALYQLGDYDAALEKLQKSLIGLPDLPGFYFVGLTAYRLNQMEQALSNFQKALDKSPSHQPSRLMIAQTLLKQGRVDDSIREASIVVNQGSPNAYAHNLLGSAYLLQKNYDQAMAELEAAIKIDPGLAQAHLKKGLFNLSTGDELQGETDLFNAVNAAPEILNTRLLLATYYLRQNNYPMALQVLEEGLAISPDSALIYNMMAAVYFGQNNPEAAVESLQKAKTLKPDFLTPYFNLASYYSQQKDYQAALSEYENVLHIAPNSLRAILRSASVYELIDEQEQATVFYERGLKTQEPAGFLSMFSFQMRNGDNDAAIQTLESGYQAHPDNQELILTYAEMLKKTGRYDDALLVYIHLEEIRPGAGKPLLLGTHLLKGDFAAAKEIADHAIASDPSSSKGYIFQSAIHENRSEWSDAKRTMRKGLAATGGDLTLKINLARLCSISGEKDEALRIFDDILRAKPDLVPVLFAKAAILDEEGDKKQAQVLYEKILDIDENYAPAINNLAFLLLDVYSDNKRALDLAVKGFRINPNDPRIIDTVGYALLQNGQIQKSISFLQKAAALMPEEAAVKLHLAQAYKAAGRYDEAIASLTALREQDASESELKTAQALLEEMN